MNIPVVQTVDTLPAILSQASAALASARTSAEVLEARDLAAAAYDAASRFTRRKAAFDHMTALAMRLQAQALKIEARAKERLADEYDAAKANNEVAGHGGARNFKVADHNLETTADLGLRRDQIHEARRIRDAERADPGAVDRSVDARLAQGLPPTRAALKRDLGIAPAPKISLTFDERRDHMLKHLYLLLHPFCRFGEQAENDDLVRQCLPFLTDEHRKNIHRAAAGLALLSKELNNG